jgi:1-acyl-sn-glycerol-3-phosphate acyltransferase
MRLSLDPIGAWARATERELRTEAFQRDATFLGALLPFMNLLSHYFGGEVRGLEHVPAGGPVLLVGNHSGGVLTPDTSVFFAAWYRRYGLDRALVGLAHDAAFGLPVFRTLMRRLGEVPARCEHADRALDAGLAVLVYPGGDHEAFRPWRERHRVDLAGRKGFIELALRQRARRPGRRPRRTRLDPHPDAG